MGKEKDTDEQSAEAAEDSVVLGELIREKREARGLSLDDAARELRLDPAVVEAMERDDFSALGAPVFIKGHLRTYARLLGLLEEELIVVFEQNIGGNDAWQAVTFSEEKVKPANLAQWGLTGLLALAFLTLMYFLFAEDDKPAVVAPTVQSAAPSVSPPVVSAPVVAVEDTAVVDVEEPVAPEPAAEVTQDLRLEFSANCWVEVYGANGSLLIGEQRRGSASSVSGQPPFRLVLGNAGAVKVFLNGDEYPIPQEAVSGRMAKFTIGSD